MISGVDHADIVSIFLAHLDSTVRDLWSLCQELILKLSVIFDDLFLLLIVER